MPALIRCPTCGAVVAGTLPTLEGITAAIAAAENHLRLVHRYQRDLAHETAKALMRAALRAHNE